MAQSSLKKRPQKPSSKPGKKVFRCREGRVIAPKRKDLKTQKKLAAKLQANATILTEKAMATRAAADGRLSLLGNLVDKKALAKNKKNGKKSK